MRNGPQRDCNLISLLPGRQTEIFFKHTHTPQHRISHINNHNFFIQNFLLITKTEKLQTYDQQETSVHVFCFTSGEYTSAVCFRYRSCGNFVEKVS